MWVNHSYLSPVRDSQSTKGCVQMFSIAKRLYLVIVSRDTQKQPDDMGQGRTHYILVQVQKLTNQWSTLDSFSFLLVLSFTHTSIPKSAPCRLSCVLPVLLFIPQRIHNILLWARCPHVHGRISLHNTSCLVFVSALFGNRWYWCVNTHRQ